MSVKSLAEIAALLATARRVVVMSHYNPDPDAYGSSSGLALGLTGLGKEVACVNESGILPHLCWIPGVSNFKSTFPSGAWDVVVACDCGDRARVGDSLKAAVSAFPAVVNIDHHASNDMFGHYNYVVPEACSTSELIVDLLEAMAAPWNPEIATCLYAGLSSDTGSFKYSSTTARTFELAQKLASRGASPFGIAQQLYARNSAASVKLHAEALSGLRFLDQGKTAFVAVTTEMLDRSGATREDADPLVDIARDIDGVVVAVLLKQDPDLWRVSLRAKGATVDVSSIASAFGGGGHKAAAGFRWRREREELERKLFSEITRALEKI